MATLKIDTKKLIDNIRQINELMSKNGKSWTLVSKVLGGHRELLELIINSDVINGISSIGDSRISGLKAIKEINPAITTMYIKPAAINYAEELVEYADISLNSSFDTLFAINKFAAKKDKIHKVIIMIEMGELREGILHENVLDFYSQIFRMTNIEVIGLGTNLGCMHGIEPTFDKLIQLSLYKQLIEAKFNRKLDVISGGTSITLPLILEGKVPKEINHFRLGEAPFLGVSPFNNERFGNLHNDAFEVDATIVEIEDKRYKPNGVISDANVGHTAPQNEDNDINQTSYKALVDFGKIDVDVENVESNDDDITFIGTTSDITVYDLGSNTNEDGTEKFKVGDMISFNLSYMGVARLMNSKFIEKVIF